MEFVMNRFGFNINFRATPADIHAAADAMLATQEYHAIEVTYYENMQDVDTFAYNQAIRQIVEEYHPQVVVHISGFNLSEENSTIRSAMIHEFRNCCKYARELGGREIVMHCGRVHGSLHVPLVPHSSVYVESTYERAWILSVQMFKTCCDIAKEYDIMIYTENLNTEHLTVRCDTLAKFVEAVDRDNLEIVFDIGHCWHTGGDIPAEVLTCGSHLRHLHLHDNDGKGDQHLNIGDGCIDYKPFCDALKQIGYPGLYMMEIRTCTPENLRICKERLLKCM